MRIGLIGCVKKKLDRPAPAADLYISPLFRLRRKYVERSCDDWIILSALHGVLAPSTIIEPYDVTLTSMGVSERRAWSREVLADLRGRWEDLGACTFEIHAGSAYAHHGLVDGLRQAGARVELPVAGLRMGEQLAWYGDTLEGMDAQAL